MLRKFLLLLCVLPLCDYADSIYNHPLENLNQADFQAVEQSLSQPNVVSGTFKQVRTVQGLSQPLVSSGTFRLSKQAGLLWQQTQPFLSTLTLTQSKIEQRMLDNPPTIITPKEQPIIFSFTHIFLSVFQGDIAQIQQHFSVYFIGTPKDWHIALIPKEAPLNKAIQHIEMQGANTISSILIADTQKNTTAIIFSKIQPG
jgi:hypothetical protein